MRKLRHITLALVALLASYGCEHKALCYLHPHPAKVRINVDWSLFTQEKPTGMTLQLYPNDPQAENITHLTHTTTHATLQLGPDTYTIMVHNLSASEFGSITFHNTNEINKTEIRTATKTSQWYTPAQTEKLGAQPEWLAFDIQQAEVTEEMVKTQVQDDHLTKSTGNQETTAPEDTLIATLVPINVVYTLHITVKIKGIENLRSARAAITGMADGYYPGQQQYHTNKTTHLAESWSLQGDCIQTSMTCFGLPTGHSGSATENTLTMELLLADNKTQINHTFNVGNLIQDKSTTNGNLHLYLNLELPEELPYVPPAGGSSTSGFNATVDDWGKGDDVNVGL